MTTNEHIARLVSTLNANRVALGKMPHEIEVLLFGTMGQAALDNPDDKEQIQIKFSEAVALCSIAMGATGLLPKPADKSPEAMKVKAEFKKASLLIEDVYLAGYAIALSDLYAGKIQIPINPDLPLPTPAAPASARSLEAAIDDMHQQIAELTSSARGALDSAPPTVEIPALKVATLVKHLGHPWVGDARLYKLSPPRNGVEFAIVSRVPGRETAAVQGDSTGNPVAIVRDGVRGSPGKAWPDCPSHAEALARMGYTIGGAS